MRWLTSGRKRIAYSLLCILAGGLYPAMTRGVSSPQIDVNELQVRADHVGASLRSVELLYWREVVLVERVVLKTTKDTILAKDIAWSLLTYSVIHDIPLDLAMGVLLVENPWFNPSIRSFMGAVGIAQIMPFHAGNWGCSGDDLENPRVNICHGMSILAHYRDRAGGDMRRALLAYNGCVHGTNTPNCHTYPDKVMARAYSMRKLWGTNVGE